MYDIDVLVEEALQNLSEILEYFGIEYTINNSWYSLTCPLHDSDNYGSLTIRTDNGVWKCWTNHCESDKIPGLISLINSLLSINLEKEVSFYETVQWLIKFLKYDESSLKIDEIDQDKIKFNNLIKPDKLKTSAFLLKKENVRKKLKIPAKFYLDKGYSPEILDRYDVGYCYTTKKPMYNRIVVPVYDIGYTNVVGCLGRTIQPFCKKCECYHYQNINCPEDNYKKRLFEKWLNNPGFKKEDYLYNIWFAKKHIEKCKTAIIVESCGNVWKLEQSGINIGLGIFGSFLSENQRLLLDKLGIMNLIIIGDNDKAGLELNKRVIKKYNRFYNCIECVPPKNDLGEMSTDEIKKLLNPILEKLL